MPQNPFSSDPNVPIIGQPCSMHGGFVSLLIVCECAARQPILLVGFGTMAKCKHCGRGFKMNAFSHDPRKGPPQIDLDIVVGLDDPLKPTGGPKPS